MPMSPYESLGVEQFCFLSDYIGIHPEWLRTIISDPFHSLASQVVLEEINA